MSKSELHNWECAIEELSGDNADKMLAIAQDIYNTAFVRGKNQSEWEQDSILDKIRAEIRAIIDEERTGNGNINKGVVIGLQMALDTIDNYKAESEP